MIWACCLWGNFRTIVWRCLKSADISSMKHHFIVFRLPGYIIYLEIVFKSSLFLLLTKLVCVCVCVLMIKNIFIISSSFFIVLDSFVMNRKYFCPDVFSLQISLGFYKEAWELGELLKGKDFALCFISSKALLFVSGIHYSFLVTFGNKY